MYTVDPLSCDVLVKTTVFVKTLDRYEIMVYNITVVNSGVSQPLSEKVIKRVSLGLQSRKLRVSVSLLKMRL